jgi:Na+-translocating ferredoxin:NAD+ oxidoreductase RnfG subunit
MKNDSVKSLVVLTACALIIMVLLAGINMATKDRIEQNNYEKMMNHLKVLFPMLKKPITNRLKTFQHIPNPFPLFLLIKKAVALQ